MMAESPITQQWRDQARGLGNQGIDVQPAGPEGTDRGPAQPTTTYPSGITRTVPPPSSSPGWPAPDDRPAAGDAYAKQQDAVGKMAASRGSLAAASDRYASQPAPPERTPVSLPGEGAKYVPDTGPDAAAGAGQSANVSQQVQQETKEAAGIEQARKKLGGQ